MRILLSIVLLVMGVAYPMAALYWLNRRMARQPVLTPRQVSVILAFNGTLPISLIIWGLSLLVPRVGAIPAVQSMGILTGLAALILLLMWRSLNLRARRPAEPAGPEPRSSDGG